MAELSTYSDVLDLVRGLIADTSTNSRLATNDQLDIWANSCLAEMTEQAEHIDWETYTTIGTVATSKIQFSDPIIGIWRVEIDEESIPPTTTAELNRSSRTWEQQTGEPRWYYLDSLLDSTSDQYTLGLWPTTSGVVSFRAIYTMMPDTVSYTDRADKVMLPLWAVHGLAWGMLSKFFASESRMQSMGASQFYEMMYNDTIVRLQARSFSRQPGYKAYGEGSGKMTSGSMRQLMPADGFPYP